MIFIATMNSMFNLALFWKSGDYEKVDKANIAQYIQNMMGFSCLLASNISMSSTQNVLLQMPL